METETWVVGAEYDDRVFERLGRALTALGYQRLEQSGGMGGSQEVSTWRVANAEGSLLIEAETYMGLSVSGPPELVRALRRCF